MHIGVQMRLVVVDGVGALYVGGLILQYPIGWASDRLGRRMLVLGLSALGAAATMTAAIFDLGFPALLVIAALMGGVSNPLYSLLVAYTNDYLDRSDMASASAGLIFTNGLGAITGPSITGWMMARVGPSGCFLFMGILFTALSIYAAWRMTRRRVSVKPEQHATFTPVSPSAGVIAVEGAMEARLESATPADDQNP